MGNVAIITDSTACLPRELAEQYSIEVVSARIFYDGRIYRDEVDISPDEFYNILSQAKELPTTSSPPPGDYLEALEKVARKANGILVITPSAKFSTMFNSAKAAAELAQEKLPKVNVDVLDCGTCAGAQGLVVLAAARAASAGENLVEAAEAAKNIMTKVNLVAFLDTLYYLAKGGQVPKVIAYANSLLRIKPIIQVLPLSGEGSIAKIVRTRAKAEKQLLDMVRKSVKERPIHVVVMHSHNLARGENLKQHLASEFRCSEIYLSDFTPVMGVHTGPGLLGVAFYAED